MPHSTPFILALVLLCAVGPARGSDGTDGRHAFVEGVMGVRARIVIDADDATAARAAARAAFDRMHALDDVMSDYRATSELMRAEAKGPGVDIAVSVDLARVLARSRELAERTRGAFDPTVGPLTRVWRTARGTGTPPGTDDVAAARRAVGWTGFHIDARARTLRFDRPGMGFDLGGIGKGFAADEALRVLEAHGFERALVDHGGDIRVGTAPRGTVGWIVKVPTVDGLEAATLTLRLERAAVATSGDAEQFLAIDGVRHSHILDPRSGKPLRGRRLITVIARDGATADALASALSVLSLPAAQPVAGELAVHARLLVRAPGADVRRVQTPGFDRFVVEPVDP